MSAPDEYYWWWLYSLYDIIFDFADTPENVIQRIGAEISIPEDLMNEIDHWRLVIESNKIVLRADLSKLVADVLAISKKYDDVADNFWTNQGFCDHPDWIVIRNKSRAYIKAIVEA